MDTKASPASALKSNRDSKYQGGGTGVVDDSFEDGASLISALAFGDASPVRPPKRSGIAASPSSLPAAVTVPDSTAAPASAVANEKSIETIPSGDDGDNVGGTKQVVAFQEENTFIDAPPELSNTAKNENGQAAVTSTPDDHGPGTMAQLHQQGRMKAYRNRVNSVNVVRKENKVDIESGEIVWRQMT
jgi:hypothetical protein